MRKNIRNNIQTLRNLRDNKRGRVSNEILARINLAVDLYEQRKITQLATAENLINSITNSTPRQRANRLKKFDDKMEQYNQSQPAGERTAQNAQKAREGKTVKNVRIRLREKTKASAISRLVRQARERGIGNRKIYTVEFMLYSLEPIGAIVRGKKINGLIYFPMFERGRPRQASIKVGEFIETLVNRTVTKQQEKPMFKKLMMFLKTDGGLKEAMPDMLDYVDAIQITKVEKTDDDGRPYNVEDEGLRESNNISIYSFYHESVIDVEKETVKEAIQSNDFRENECWINELLKTYEGSELMREKRGKLAKTLSRNKILELLNRTEEDIHEYGISINQMEKVFKFFNIPVKLYNYRCQLIYKFEPNDFKNGRRKTIFVAFIKNNHVYPINANQDRLCQLKVGDQYCAKASSNFLITDKTEPPKFKMFSHIDELLKMTEHEEYNLIHKDNNLNEVLFQFRKAGYEPMIKYQGNRIVELRARYTEKKTRKVRTYIIKTQDLSKEIIERDVYADTEEKYNRIVEAMFDFNSKVFSESHKSDYSALDVTILDECRTVVPSGYFDKNVDVKTLCEIDRTKAFTWAFIQIKEIPVFSEFDDWKIYNDTKIEDLNLYMVQVYSSNIFFNKKYNLVYGKFLKKMIENKTELKIICYKKPYYIHKVNYSDVVDELNQTVLSDDIEEDKSNKKRIANITFGMLEKSNNTAQRSYIFNSLREAIHYQRLSGGKIYAIQEETVMYEIDEHDNEETTKKEGEKLYILNVTDKTKLMNGFRFVKELLLQYHNFSMYEAYNKLVENNIKVYSVKSDAFTIHEDDLTRVVGKPNHFIKSYRTGILQFEAGTIGNWRVTSPRTSQGEAVTNKSVNFPTCQYKFKHNDLIEIPVYENEPIDVVDEFDTRTICNQIIQQNPVIIRARFAGSGKTYIARYFQKIGKNVLFVVPHNRLSQEIDGEATTYNMFFRIPVHKGDDLPEFDHGKFDVIFFDEIYMTNRYIYKKVLHFRYQHEGTKIIIGAGDCNQLPPIQDLTNTQPHDSYADQCMDKIFKYNIYLKICKRVGEKDRLVLEEMWNDFWIHKLPLRDIIKTYFKTTNKINPNDTHIAYTNDRCRYVSDEVRKQLGYKNTYEIGEEIVCKLYLKQNGQKFNANIRYKILCINGSKITIENIKDKKKHTLDEDILYKHFRHGYCSTAHSYQGASVKNHITIHEWQRSRLVTREWAYTAITRCVDLNNVSFYENTEAEQDRVEQKLINYFKNKIEGYKQQDKRNLREINLDNYVDVDWCMDRLKSTCGKCGCDFYFETKQGVVTSNFTAQRTDNLYPHSKDNIIAYCNYCNCSSK